MRMPYEGRCRITKLFGTPPPAGMTYAAGYHTGLDLVGMDGKEIHACFGGTVTASHYDTTGWGNYVAVYSSAQKTTALYCHMASRKVSVGERVEEGQVLGEEGATGNVTGRHLHLEMRRDRTDRKTAFDPCSLLGIEAKLGEVELLAQITKASIVLPSGKTMQVDAIVQDGTNYVALRAVLEAMGHGVDWQNGKIIIK